MAIRATEAPMRTRPSNYPEPFASRMAGRQKHRLGDLLGLANFGVNLTRLAPEAVSALRGMELRTLGCAGVHVRAGINRVRSRYVG
jgi:uncharacterized cupin superfamily protein